MMKILAIAKSAWREVIRQPAIWIVAGLTFVMILLFRYFTFFGLGEERSMIREMALASMTLAGLIVAILGSSTVLTNEQEKRTLLTLLSKPILRNQIITGKFLGIAFSVLVVFVPLTLVYVGAVCWSEATGHRFSSITVSERVVSFFSDGAAWNLVKASVLSYAGVAVMAAISIAISTRMPMIVNAVLSIAVFVLGHQAGAILALLYPKTSNGTLLIEQTDSLGFFGILMQHPLLWAGKIIYGIVPDLEAFNAGEIVAANQLIPGVYVAKALGYAVLYIAFALLIAQVFFRRREFA